MRLLSLLLVCVLAGPVAARTVVTETSIEILDDIHFVGTSTQIAPSSLRTLDAIARALAGNPEITQLEVVACGTDLPSTQLQQLALGAARARAIVLALEQRGISPRRLTASGGMRPANPMFLIRGR